MDNLVCCRLQGAQQGGLQPIDTDQTHCTAGSPTPLASLAATNSKNAAPFLVTYTSASYGETTTGDFIPAQVPTCIWMNTNTAQSDGVGVKTVTVPAASISTLPATATYFGLPMSPDSTVGYPSSSSSRSRGQLFSNEPTPTGTGSLWGWANSSSQTTASSKTTTVASTSSTATSKGSLTVKSSGVLILGLWGMFSGFISLI